MSIVNLVAGESFDEVLKKHSAVAVVDFWAPWCNPCRMMSPELESVAEELDGKLTVIKINVDDFGELASEKFKVLGVPTLVLFKDGEEEGRLVGYKPKSAIKDFLQKHVGNLKEVIV